MAKKTVDNFGKSNNCHFLFSETVRATFVCSKKLHLTINFKPLAAC